MILRKPYAFFIKMFKPLHLTLAIVVAYLIYLQNKILIFLNSYIYSTTSAVGENIKDKLASNLLFIIPIILIIFSLIILGIMFKKEKKFTFYVISIFSFVVVLVINLYASNFLGVLEKSIVSIKTVKLIHDLVLINMVIESISFVFLIVRGMGINIKKFDFDSDISKINVSDSDKEEFEVKIDVDLNESKRKRKKRLRYLKYFYLEKKTIINLVLVLLLCVFIISALFILKMGKRVNKEGNIYSTNTFSFGVDDTLIIDTDYRGNKISENYLIVVDVKMKSNISGKSLLLKDFSLKIDELIFKPTLKYSNFLIDLGDLYDESILSNEYTNYLFVYEVPEKYIKSDMIFNYNGDGNSIDIFLNPKDLATTEISISKQINEQISFEKTLGNIMFKIKSYEIKDKFLLEYDYCIKQGDCILSKEYLKPSIDENFDKYILKLDIEYRDNSDLNIETFYDFFFNFGSIYYSIDGNWYYQKSNFEKINSSKTNTKNNVYIGVNSEIYNATSIKLIFDIRGSKYEYLLK